MRFVDTFCFANVLLLVSDFVKEINEGSSVSNFPVLAVTDTINQICDLPQSSSSLGGGGDVLSTIGDGQVSQFYINSLYI